MNVVPTSPITTVRMLTNVPLDSTYTDTLTFSSASAQASYFAGKAQQTFSNLTPVRITNAIRIPTSADSVYNCNYVMFQNANFGSKWFYAFIKEIEYVNVNMCMVHIELDAMQTWMFNYTVKPSFVEREHVTDDTRGANLVPENLELGEYVFADHNKSGLSNSSRIYVASTVDSNGENVEGGMYGGTYAGVNYYSFATAADANAYISALTTANKSDAIVSVFMACPQLFPTKDGGPAHVEFSINNLFDNFQGYKPKNNKLFTYPYFFLYCTNLQGNTAEFRYEFFDNPGKSEFTMFGNATCNPTITLVPLNYKYPEGNGNLNEKMTLDGFPQCAYNIDTYKAWLAQNGASTAVSVLGTAGGVAAGIAGSVLSGGTLAIAGAVGGVTAIASTVAKVTATSAKPAQAKGSPGASSLYDYGVLDFHFYKTTITAEFARIIDNFFDMFGYAVNRVKVPNITGRPSWNYVKTTDVKIVGSIPFDDMNTIKANFNRGITFWHGDWVGDYTRANK